MKNSFIKKKKKIQPFRWVAEVIYYIPDNTMTATFLYDWWLQVGLMNVYTFLQNACLC